MCVSCATEVPVSGGLLMRSCGAYSSALQSRVARDNTAVYRTRENDTDMVNLA